MTDFALWRRTPLGTPPLAFRGTERTRPEIAVAVLLDASDSTADDGDDGGTSVFRSMPGWPGV